MLEQFKQEFLDFINGGFFEPLEKYKLTSLSKEFLTRLGNGYVSIEVNAHNGYSKYVTFFFNKEFKDDNDFLKGKLAYFHIKSFDLCKNKELQNELLAFLETGEVGDLIKAEVKK